MGDLRTRNANRWANYLSFFPIWGGAAANAIRSNALAKNQQEAANEINPVDEIYKPSEFAKEQLNMARQAVNARMPGAAQQENNLFRNQANTFNNLSRAATPQQMIAAGGAVQGNTNDALANLAAQEQQFRNSMLGNLNAALGVNINEGDKVYQDKTNRFNREFNMKQGLLNAAEQNRANVGNSIQSGVNSIANTLLNFTGAFNTTPKPDLSVKPTGFNPAAGWFNMPNQANYTPTIYGRP